MKGLGAAPAEILEEGAKCCEPLVACRDTVMPVLQMCIRDRCAVVAQELIGQIIERVMEMWTAVHVGAHAVRDSHDEAA